MKAYQVRVSCEDVEPAVCLWSRLIAAKLALELPTVAYNRVQRLPELPTMVLVPGVDQLVNENVVAKLLGQTDQMHVQVDVVVGRATAPQSLLVLDEDLVVRKSMLPGQVFKAFKKLPARLGAVEPWVALFGLNLSQMLLNPASALLE